MSPPQQTLHNWAGYTGRAHGQREAHELYQIAQTDARHMPRIPGYTDHRIREHYMLNYLIGVALVLCGPDQWGAILAQNAFLRTLGRPVPPYPGLQPMNPLEQWMEFYADTFGRQGANRWPTPPR